MTGGQTAPAVEPVRQVGDQRPEARGRADADEQTLPDGELPDRGGRTGEYVAGAKHDGRDHQRPDNAECIDGASDPKVAECEADHRQCVWQGGACPIRAKFCLYGREHDDDRPQADAAHRADQDAYEQAHPGLRPVNRTGGRLRGVPVMSVCVHDLAFPFS